MNRNQPKITIRKIKHRFKIIGNEISQLVEDKYYFEKYKEYINKSISIDKEQNFLFFITKNYQQLSVINVCKQVSTDSREESLINLLKDIKNNKNLFTLKWYKRQWRSRFKEAELYFREFSIKNNQLMSVKKVNKDIREIEKAINGLRYGKKTSVASLRKYRNKRGAHFDKRKSKISVPVEDLYKAINLLEKMFLKYDMLINNVGQRTLLPINIDDYLGLEKVFLK